MIEDYFSTNSLIHFQYLQRMQKWRLEHKYKLRMTLFHLIAPTSHLSWRHN